MAEIALEEKKRHAEAKHRFEGGLPVVSGAPRAHLPALTGLRFVLALWVVLHHLNGPGMMLDAAVRGLPAGAASIVRHGYLAVATFFVLSGFVLALSYGGAGWTCGGLWRYAVARFARIYPVYALSMMIVLPFMIAARVAGKAWLVADYGLLLQGWTGTLPVHWNTPAWSLSCEVFFYLCFPLAAAPLARARWGAVAAALVSACLLPTALLRLGVPHAWKPLVHLADFVAGIAAARAYALLAPRLGGRGHWLYAPAAAALAALLAWPQMVPAPLNAVMRPLNALLLAGLALGGGLGVRALSTRSAVFLGKASYAMYILHVPILWWYKRLLPPMPAYEAALVYIALVTAISGAVFLLVEQPANRALRERLGRAA
ncbi:MAG: acyltransferase family protein [Bryobacteraceae bacterium]